MDNTPFFILGCVRSGTTLLRDMLRLHPRLECPEETHFFRWPDPFGTDRYNNNYKGAKLFKTHRQMDEIPDLEFHCGLQLLGSRKELSDHYAKLYLKGKGNPEGRWFDKTPQNVYGILLISSMYPDSKFVHIYRNPLNVVSSLVEGKVMAKHNVIGGVNYWMESMRIIDEYKKLAPMRIIEVCYEQLVLAPQKHVNEILTFLNEDISLIRYQEGQTHKEKNKFKKVLSREDIEIIKTKTEPYYSAYGYAE